MRFRDRQEAGQLLADHLREFAGRSDVIVLALPRGGVPVAAEIARALGVHLDTLVVRKIGLPSNPEFAVGAMAHGGMMVLDELLLHELGLSRRQLMPVILEEEEELERREQLYRGTRAFPRLEGQVVILVDDGLATGSTMEAAVRMVRTRAPARIIVAVPVGSQQACGHVGALADSVVCLLMPEPFFGVGVWYVDFSATSDQEVLELLTSVDQSHPRHVALDPAH
jgi:putative phosphoribosyl transferase